LPLTSRLFDLSRRSLGVGGTSRTMTENRVTISAFFYHHREYPQGARAIHGTLKDGLPRALQALAMTAVGMDKDYCPPWLVSPKPWIILSSQEITQRQCLRSTTDINPFNDVTRNKGRRLQKGKRGAQ